MNFDCRIRIVSTLECSNTVRIFEFGTQNSINTYLRNTMSEERLNALTVSAINKT